MRFVVDAQLPPALARNLTSEGHQAEHINEIGMAIAADIAIWEYAEAAGAVIVSKDEDFAKLVFETASGPQVIWIRLGNITNEALWHALKPLLPELIEALESDERLIEVT